MNEKIRELRQQATIIVGAESGFAFDREVIDQQKFAELIVRECMAQIKEVKELSLPYNANREQAYEFGYDDGMTVAIRTIEEHFGVEE